MLFIHELTPPPHPSHCALLCLFKQPVCSCSSSCTRTSINIIYIYIYIYTYLFRWWWFILLGKNQPKKKGGLINGPTIKSAMMPSRIPGCRFLFFLFFADDSRDHFLTYQSSRHCQNEIKNGYSPHTTFKADRQPCRTSNASLLETGRAESRACSSLTPPTTFHLNMSVFRSFFFFFPNCVSLEITLDTWNSRILSFSSLAILYP